MSRSERMNTRPPSTRPCTRPAICRISFAPRCSCVSTLRPRSIDVEELHVVDDDRVEPAHVERALPRRRHREEIRLLLAALEKRTDDADRLAAVIERRVDARRRCAARARPLPRRRAASARTARRRAAPSPSCRRNASSRNSQRLLVHDAAPAPPSSDRSRRPRARRPSSRYLA